MENNQQLTAEELKQIQEMNTEFNNAKLSIGDLELQKSNVIKHIEKLRESFAKNEMELIAKYGTDAVINIQTGEVTKKQD
jgi:hypothetical protein